MSGDPGQGGALPKEGRVLGLDRAQWGNDNIQTTRDGHELAHKTL